jgi:DNA polymerase-3 subunit alpha
MQSIYFAIHFNPIYWNTACLIVNSGATDEESGGSTDYGKIAKAIGDIKSAGIKISLANINKSGFGFVPDVENNQILFGLKGMLNVGDDVITSIIDNRPYLSPKDFLHKVKPNKQAMISLIKGGAFDEMEDRKFVMTWYIWETCDKKNRLTLQNMPGLIKYGLLPEENDKQILARRVYEFNRYLKAICKTKNSTGLYQLDERAIAFLTENGWDNLIQSNNGYFYLNESIWDKKIYQSQMDVFRNWITSNKDTILNELNFIIFQEDWNKYAKGNVSAWEMEVLCFYHHQHELASVNATKYGFVDFFKLPPEPVVEKTFVRGGRDINIFKLNKICGTCIAKDKTKSTVTLLTTTGVVNIKFRKEMFALYDKQISARGSDGVKHIVEKSWFNRGNKITVMGIRSGDDFLPKKYASTNGHQLYKIDEIMNNGDIILRSERALGELEEENNV